MNRGSVNQIHACLHFSAVDWPGRFAGLTNCFYNNTLLQLPTNYNQQTPQTIVIVIIEQQLKQESYHQLSRSILASSSLARAYVQTEHTRSYVHTLSLAKRWTGIKKSHTCIQNFRTSNNP